MNGIALIKKEKGRSVYAAYTLCFFAFSALIIAIYAAAGKSFVWWDDGISTSTLLRITENICARSFRVFCTVILKFRCSACR